MRNNKSLAVLSGAAFPLALAALALLSRGSAIVEADVFPLPEKSVTASQLSQWLLKGNYPVSKGYNPAAGGHAGIDFYKAGDGVTSVYSPISGTIIANEATCGKVAIYDGVKNTVILAHMTSRTSLSVGSQITAGTYVGKVSQVVGGGCVATGPHLHIEIRPSRTTIMAEPKNDNTKTTLDPLSYQYDTNPPTISIASPAQGATLSTGSSYTLSWSASDPSGVGDVAVDLISGSATTCYGASAITSIRLAGAGYVSSLKWAVPTSLSRGSYKIKVAARDNLNNWGCVMVPITLR